MKTITKRILSLVLCFVMLTGMLPVGALAAEAETTAPSEILETQATEATVASVEATEATQTETSVPETTAPSETETEAATEAAEEDEPEIATGWSSRATAANGETVVDAAIFCSDVHGVGSDLTSVLGGVATSGVDYSAIGLVGDTCLTVANTTSIVQSALGDTDIAVMFSYASSHDTEDGADIDEDWNYSGEVEGVSKNYLVYTIRETDMQNASGASTAAPAFTTWYNGLTAAEKALPIFIMSHRPLHDRRDDNAGAATWYTAISAAAKTSDIIFFWAHNHTGESSADTAAYYVAKNGTETFTVYNGDTVIPNFTYMNAGYINANGQNPARKGVATTVQITANSLIFQDYNSSGEYSGTYAHNVTVAREFAAEEVTLDSITISGTTEYFVGDTLALTVTATYSDGKTANVTADATLTGYDKNTAGTQTVTATYGGKTATIDITVTAVQVNSIAVTTPPTKLTYVTGEELDTTGMVVTATYNNGTTAEVTGWYTSYVDMTTAGEKTVTVNYAVDNITYKTTFTITVEQGVAEGVTLESIEITKIPEKTEYLISQELELGSMVVVATFSDGSTVELEYKPFSTSTVYGGYELDNFSMYVEKAHEVKVTYTYGEVTCTDTFTINVWDENFTDEATGVKVQVTGDYGVTAASVEVLDNEVVADAVADVISGTNYVTYDISLNFDEGYETTNATKTVTLPIPEGVNNPVVYYVSGETATNMNATVSGNTVVFDTTHFSKYVVGESTEIEVPNPEDAENVTGTTTTTTDKTVYVLVSTPTAGNQYIIVSSGSAGSGYALKENTTTGTSVTINAASGSITAPYIETSDETIMWNATSGLNFQSENGGYYLNYSSSSSGSNRPGSSASYSLSFSTSSASDWTAGTNALYRNGQSNDYYLRCNSGTWAMGSSNTAYNVYFYEKQTIKVETSTETTGTYSIEGEDLTSVVKAESTANLTSTLIFTPDSGDATTTDVSTTATYEIVTKDVNGNTVNGDPNGIISKIENGVVTFTGNYGKALVKVSYTTDFGVVTDYITVTASAPYYSIDLHKADVSYVEAELTDGFEEGVEYYIKNEDGTYTKATEYVSGTTYYVVEATVGDEITDTVSIKGIEKGDTYSVWAVIKEYDGVLDNNGEDGASLGNVADGKLTWESSDETVATVDSHTGIITFTGKEGTVDITASYDHNGDKKYITDTITISVTPTQYTVPADGTGDFPEYPNEGAVRYDKTATAVGNFSQTGLTQIELSMTGVPYTTGSEIDVVLMLDMTGSMSDDSMAAAEAAALAFAKQIILNEDGTYNSNRISVQVFSKDGVTELWAMSAVTTETYSSLVTAIESASTKQASGGTPYSTALQACYNTLDAAKTDGTGNNRQQFCVFVSDGTPTSMTMISNYDAVKNGTATTYTTTTSSTYYGTYPEYYSTLMKDNGVSVYGVYTSAAAGSTGSGGSANDTETATEIMQTIASSDDDVYVVEDYTDTSAITDVFTNIAQKILQAATDVTIEDKITDEYTMVFDIPEGTKDISGITNDFYIEFVEYALDADHERTGTPTSLAKLYLKNTNDVYSAAKDSSGTAYDAPVFEAKTLGDKGTLYYWTTDTNYKAKAAVTYTVDGTSYYFIPYGMKATDTGFDSTKWFNMTSGAYAYGTVDSTTNMSNDLVIATPYFVYNQATKKLYWTVDKIGTTEYALRYFLYLDQSATEIGTDNEIPAGPYETNEYATITYTNFNGNECQQKFPVPQMTWNGATVSYVFYLVNADGQPINKSGQVVDFANASFVTDVFTHTVVWNGTDAVEELNVEYLADDLLPDAYTIYDEKAEYTIHVYQDETGNSVFDYFIIEGSAEGTVNAENGNKVNSDDTTKVYNTKAGTKYSEYGTYSAEDVGTEFKTKDANGNTVTITTTKQASLDYSNTTVAFAVVWEPKLVEDTIVVDYGLDVLINVTENDLLENTSIKGIGLGKEAYGSAAMNTGVVTESKLGTADLTTNDGSTIHLENATQIRFTQNDMEFEEPAVFYYETPVEFYEGSTKQEGYMYSRVTVIPATTVYYEESFTTLQTSGSAQWETVGTESDNTQAQDRPGTNKILEILDANNVYGYDEAYATMNGYSNGSSKKITVSKGNDGRASFTFYGTGFDVISLTDNSTGMIIVKVYSVSDTGAKTLKKSLVVDTYYGMEADGTVSVNNPEALYQIPVMKVSDLAYGKYYVTITATYQDAFDHGQNAAQASDTTSGSYNFYLDAIRIYDPTGVASGSVTNDTVLDAYKADNEAWPIYEELRNKLIAAANYTVTENEDGTVTVTGTDLSGAIFIDSNDGTTSIADYVNYGPNNELYLSNGQSVAFGLDLTPYSGIIADVQIGIRNVGTEDALLTMHKDSLESTALITPTESATDRYYSIGNHVINKDGTAGLTNLMFCNAADEAQEGEAKSIISITNIKFTFKENPNSTSAASVFSADESVANWALMTLRATPEVEEEEIPETTVPEETEPEVTEPEDVLDADLQVSISSTSVKVGSTIVVIATTSDDVDALTVNGKEVTKYVESRFTGKRTWTTTVKASEAGNLSIEVAAYSAEGETLETVTESVKVSGQNAGVVQQIIGSIIGMLFR